MHSKLCRIAYSLREQSTAVAGVMLRSIMYKFASLICVLTLTGCSFFIMGENVLLVSAELDSKQYKDCSIHLVLNKEINARDYNIQPVTGKFSEAFTVSPNREQVYTARVICESQIVASRTAKYSEVAGEFNFDKID